ncbi:MAG: hypothetical protein IT259_19990 [Saprospiraceae bacterium]|nr:hypothetical protein [Saprospiraceae bacterium]
MNTQEDLFQNWFRRLQVIYFALLAGQFIAAATLRLVISPLSEPAGSPTIFIGLIAILIIAGHVVFRKKTAGLVSLGTLSDRMNDYFVAFLLRAALSEAAVLIGLVAYHFICGDRVLYVATMVGLLNFLALLPQRAQVTNQVGL